MNYCRDHQERCSPNKPQQTSTVEGNTPEAQRKKLPSWMKIPCVSVKTNQPQSTSVLSTAETKGNSDEEQVKKSDKATGSKVRKSSPDANSSKQNRDRGSRKREKSNSRRSSKGKEERSKERSSRSERNSRRHDREESSHRRKRSRSRDTDRRDTKSSRSGHDRSSRRSGKNEDRKSPREPSKTKDSKPKSDIESMNETSPKNTPLVPFENKETISQKLPEKAAINVLNETEPVINEDDFSMEELELIGKCIEEQMTEEEELIKADFDTEEVKTETNVAQEKSLSKETEKRQQSSDDNVLKITKELSNDKKIMDEFDRKNEIVITGKTEETESVCKEKNDTTSETCVVEISMDGSSPERSKESERDDHETAESSIIEINMNIQRHDLNVIESSTIEEEKLEPPKKEEGKSEPNIDIKSTVNIVTPSTGTVAEENFIQETSQSGPEQREFRTERDESKIGTDVTEINPGTIVENKRTDIHVEEKQIFVTEEQSQIQVSSEDVLKGEIKPMNEDKNITGASTTENSTVTIMTDTLEGDFVADFENFIASELGEDFVTVDDFQDSSPDMETELDVKVIPENTMSVNEQDHLIQSVEKKNNSRVVDINKPNNEPEKTDNSKNKNQEIFSETNISGIEVQNPTFLGVVFEKESDFDIKGERSFSKSNERHDSNKEVNNTNDTEEIPNVHVDKVTLKSIDEPSISECAEVDATMEPYDDSGDMEFILTDEFLTVDEHIEIDAEMEGSEAVIICQNTTGGTTSESNIPSEEMERDIKTECVSSPNQKEDYDKFKLPLEPADQPVIEPLTNIDISVTCKDENVDILITSKDENVDIAVRSKDESVEKVCSEVISSLPVDNDEDDDDDDDIEEIFLGGDFVTVDTVDESKEKTPTPVEDTVGEEFNEEDFFSEDFVTVDEVDVDADASANTIKQTDEKDKSIFQITGLDSSETFQMHSSRNENKIPSARSRSKGSRSKERSVSRDTGRSSKDRSELKVCIIF